MVKMSATARRMMPGCRGVPVMVYVLPEPVQPYAKIVALYLHPAKDQPAVRTEAGREDGIWEPSIEGSGREGEPACFVRDDRRPCLGWWISEDEQVRMLLLMLTDDS
jgi:hypothetical protein